MQMVEYRLLIKVLNRPRGNKEVVKLDFGLARGVEYKLHLCKRLV